MNQVPILDLLQQIIQEYQKKKIENEHLNTQFISGKTNSFILKDIFSTAHL